MQIDRRVAMWVVCAAVLGVGSAASADRDPVTGEIVGDTSPVSFAEACRRDLLPDQEARFYESLGRAESALAAGETETGVDALQSAIGAAYRGGAESNLAVKCLGRPAAKRFIEAQLESYRQHRSSTADPMRLRRPELIVLAVDSGADAVVRAVEASSMRGFVSAVRILERAVERLEAHRDFGAFLVSQEEKLLASGRAALAPLRDRAAREHEQALATESGSFSRAATDEETEAAELYDAGTLLADALAGVDLGAEDGAGMDRDAMLLAQRIRESQELLRRARSWNLAEYENEQARPTSQRARERGNEMLARGKDDAASLALREIALESASEYFEFGGFDDEVARADAALAALRPALDAQARQRNAAREEAKQRLEREAAAIRKSAEDIKKSDAERRSFEAEADALEDELGF